MSKRTGFKVMNFNNGKIQSGANSSLSFDFGIGSELSMQGIGVFIAMDKQYALDYYSGLADEEVLLTVEFDVKDINRGNINDLEPELAVSKVNIVNIEYIKDGLLISNQEKKQSRKRNKP